MACSSEISLSSDFLYSFYNTIRGYGPDVVSSMARTVIDLQSHGTDPAGMVRKLESLGSEIGDLENRKEQLAQDVSSAEEAMKEKNEVRKSLEREISELHAILTSLKQQKKDITNEIKKNSHRIAKSDRFWSAADERKTCNSHDRAVQFRNIIESVAFVLY